MQVRIYQPAKSAMQSGRGNAKKWLMEYEPTARRSVDPLMGWTDVEVNALMIHFDAPWAIPPDPDAHGWMSTIEEKAAEVVA